jgi:hypothetical protein
VFVGCSRKEHHSQCRPGVISRTEDFGETVRTTSASCHRRCRRSAATSPSLHSQSSAGSSVKPSQPNSSAFVLVKIPKPSSST